MRTRRSAASREPRGRGRAARRPRRCRSGRRRRGCCCARWAPWRGAGERRVRTPGAAWRARPPKPGPGGVVDHHRVELGRGAAAFGRACEALRRWEMFRIGWVELHPADAPIRVGTTVGVLVRVLGLWSLNPCRIVALVEEGGAIERFGFVYCTLPGHAERGEEHFVVEWRHDDDVVAYDLRARSRPAHPLVWLGYPVARVLQRRFARESMRAMARAAHESVRAP